MGELDPDTRMFRVSNGGCPYPYYFEAATGKIVELGTTAYPMGVRPDTEFEVTEKELLPADRVVFCSDGIPECLNADSLQFGFDRTRDVVCSACREGLTAEETIDMIFDEVSTFRGDTPQTDDMTCVVLRVEN